MPEQQEEEEEEVCEAGSGQGTPGQPPLHFSHGLEPLLQGNTINSLVEDWDFIVPLVEGGETGQRDQGAKRKRIIHVKSIARGWSCQASIPARRESQSFLTEKGYYFLCSLCTVALISPHFLCRSTFNIQETSFTVIFPTSL